MTPHLVCKTRIFDGEGNKQIEKLNELCFIVANLYLFN